MGVSLGPTLQTSAGEREHVDQPARSAGDVVCLSDSVELAATGRAENVLERLAEPVDGYGNQPLLPHLRRQTAQQNAYRLVALANQIAGHVQAPGSTGGDST